MTPTSLHQKATVAKELKAYIQANCKAEHVSDPVINAIERFIMENCPTCRGGKAGVFRAIDDSSFRCIHCKSGYEPIPCPDCGQMVREVSRG